MGKTKIDGLAEAVEARRKELGLTPGQFVEESGLTQPGLATVRNGEDRAYQEKTILGVAKALRWEIDWLDRLRAGTQPRPAGAPDDEVRNLSGMGRDLEDIRTNDPEEYERLLDEIRYRAERARQRHRNT